MAGKGLSCATRRPGWRSHTAGMCRVLSPTSVVGAIEAKNLHRAIGNPRITTDQSSDNSELRESGVLLAAGMQS